MRLDDVLGPAFPVGRGPVAELKPPWIVLVGVSAPYRPRQAVASPLYRLFQDHLESYLARRARDDSVLPAFVEKSFRAFLECGVHRFGVVRFRCPSCGQDLFVALGYPAYCTSLDRVEMTGSVSADSRPGSS